MKDIHPSEYQTETWDLMQLMIAGFNDHQVRCEIRLDAHIDMERLKRAVDLLADAFPLIRCRLKVSSGRPRWQDAGFTAEHMVALEQTSCVEPAIQKALCIRIEEQRGPQLRIHVVRAEKADVLCVVINHMLCDGTGFKELLYLLGDIYSKLARGEAYKPASRMGSRSARQVLRALGWKSRAGILFARYGLSRHDNGIKLNLDGNADLPFIVTHSLGRGRFLGIKAYGKQRGVSVNDMILAAYLRALYKTLGKTASIQCVTDLRKYLPGKKTESFCNLISNLACDIGTEIGETFDDTLKKVKSAMDAEKEDRSCLHLILQLEILFQSLPFKTAKALVLKYYRNPPLAMSNIGILDHRLLTFAGVSVTGAYMTGSVKYKPYFLLSLSTFRDEMTLSSAFHGTREDEGKIERLLMDVDRELPGFGRHGHSGAD